MLSLVLATVGRVTEIHRFIDSLLAQTAKDFELIVVDQNSDDRLASVLSFASLRGVRVEHLRLHPPNLSAARNLGVVKARGEFVAFPDDDCWYEPDTVERVLSALGATSAPGGIVGRWVEQSASESRPQLGGPISPDEWARFRGGDASSITLFFRTALLRDLGGFDTRFGVGGWFGCGEETDLLLRALRTGTRIDRVPEARVHHRFSAVRDALSAAAIKRARGRGRGIGGLYAKHSLPVMVIVRGLVSGWVKPVLNLEGPGSWVLSAAESLGRLEGLLRWRFASREAST